MPVVAVAHSEIRKDLFLLRLDPDLRVAENHKEIVIGNRSFVPLCQVVAFRSGQRHDQTLLI